MNKAARLHLVSVRRPSCLSLLKVCRVLGPEGNDCLANSIGQRQTIKKCAGDPFKTIELFNLLLL